MNLENLSNAEIENQLLGLVHRENEILHEILLYIKEVDIRRLYLSKGRASLFEYLVTDLGYSGSSAQRRIEGARLMRDIPQVGEMIKERSLQLCQLGSLTRAVRQKETEANTKISKEQKLGLLKSIECRTGYETQKILAQSLDINLKAPEIKTIQKDDSVSVQLTFTKEQFEKIQACKNLLSHQLLKDGDLGTANLIETLADSFLKSQKVEKSTTKAGEVSTAISAVKTNDGNLVKPRANKTLTVETRKMVRQIFKTCQHVNPKTSKQCKSQFLLEVDHIKPRWAGGTNEKSNLTLLCANHNKAKYRQNTNTKLVSR